MGEDLVHLVLEFFQEFEIRLGELGCQAPGVVIWKLMSGQSAIGISRGFFVFEDPGFGFNW